MPAKAAIIALSAIGITGTGGVFLYKNFTKTTVRDKLQENPKIKILTEENEEWQKIVSENYEEPKKSNLENFIKKYSSSENITDGAKPEDLKAACEKILEEESNDNNMAEAQKYCCKNK